MLNPEISNIELSLNEYKRYSRHFTLKNIGVEGQKRLKAAKVICIGAGGLNSPVIMYLSAAGIGYIGIVDYDKVDISNLQRQIIYDISNIGQSKTFCAKSRVISLNPYCNVVVYETKLNLTNAYDIISQYDIIVDGTDNFQTRYLLNDIACMLYKPFVYGAILQFSGQLTVFNYQGGPNYQNLYPIQPPNHLIPSCSEGGILGPLAGVIGSLQAIEVLKIILGIGKVLNGKLLVYDALKIKFIYISINCAKYFIKSNITNRISLYNFHKIIIKNNLKQLLLLSSGNHIIIDVRTSHEYNLLHNYNAINIPLSRIQKLENLIFLLKQIKKNKHLIIYCQSQSRSVVAYAMLLKYQIKAAILKVN
nr:molybdopterin biosynthesis protein [Boldiaceae sp.]